jgi:hypothetical protein
VFLNVLCKEDYLERQSLGLNWGHPTKLSRDGEEKLVDLACNRAALGVGFGRTQFISFAEKFATKHSKEAGHQ